MISSYPVIYEPLSDAKKSGWVLVFSDNNHSLVSGDFWPDNLKYWASFASTCCNKSYRQGIEDVLTLLETEHIKINKNSVRKRLLKKK